MCNVTKQKPSSVDSVMENNETDKQKKTLSNLSVLLELSASDDLAGFKTAMEEDGLAIDQPSSWYGRRIGSRKMTFEDRTPLMVAAMFGSKNVLGYILESGLVDVNRSCGSDHATALHCAVAGGATSSLDVVEILLRACADANALDVNGNRPVDLIAPSSGSSFNPKRKIMESLLKSSCLGEGCALDDLVIDELENEKDEHILTPIVSKDRVERKEYPIDLSLPDIKNGIYGTDEFRMYMFKVKPCSRAYSHDWTECPYVHPGENARRRDPRRYHYSCVPCLEYRKGMCRQGDNCEYAHGIFECWLHPAQYRTRLCKDETNCIRRVCFFAHKTEELRPLYSSTGSSVPSPRSYSNGGLPSDFPSISPLALGGSSLMKPSMNRLKTSSELDTELLMLDSRRRQLMDEISSLSSPSAWNSVKPTNLDDDFGTFDSLTLSQLQGLSIDASSSTQLQSSYPSSPLRASSSFGKDSLGYLSTAARAATFAKRSQSFIDRGPASVFSGISSSTLSPNNFSSHLSDWGSPDGKLDWGIKKDELNKLRKSASFGFRSSGSSETAPVTSRLAVAKEPDVSWVQSLVKDGPTNISGEADPSQNLHYLHLDQEQIVA